MLSKHGPMKAIFSSGQQGILREHSNYDFIKEKKNALYDPLNATKMVNSSRMFEYDELISYFIVSCAALLAYDYCLTLDLERKFVWSKPCKWSNILYLFQRYLPLVDTVILFTISTFSSNTGYCDSIFNASLCKYGSLLADLPEMIFDYRVTLRRNELVRK
ncbi:hypothetical protein DFJ43DRAFT_872818 [Lentinula guzmanii]|uniref:DUF6533 domain-containing protein n=1 Tax=Lentinula guzmanii TaxID=2804957 RepID=A0AA38JGR7_9AGAR|nr:hypothetical protein DFJ43DRAFT_872818 [Lentinula guzmanii]